MFGLCIVTGIACKVRICGSYTLSISLNFDPKTTIALAPTRGCLPQTVYCWGSILRKKLATLTGRAPELCGWALWPRSVSGPCPPLVLVLAAPLNSVAGLSGPPLCLALPSSCPCLGWPRSVSGSCPPVVLVLASPLNSVAGLCGPGYWREVWPNK